MTTRILIVEDDALIGFDLAELLSGAGFTIVGIATNTVDAMALFNDQGCDVALLDVNLGTETSASIAHELAARGVPFVTMTGYSLDQCPAVFRDAPFVIKPFTVGRLITQINRCVECVP